MKIETPIEFMLALEWEKDDLENAKKFLRDWDSRNESFYKNHKKFIKDADVAEREHYRNCVEFWEKKLNED